MKWVGETAIIFDRVMFAGLVLIPFCDFQVCANANCNDGSTKMCMLACPFGAIGFDSAAQVCFKYDLCGGGPKVRKNLLPRCRKALP